ncbi:DUF6481 family protein [Microvirga alba]|uniref:Uncharacterized protein n=1 Tax=Microvirga alba TaxID=2791025 RepID=A0A931FPJ5_9HYPH|nr:DUF6481 family protein [Microvirga alba]MBF9233557.1 hypothetical protein [Microvirga alba]
MSGFRDIGFGDRLSTAENARKAMLERVRAKPGPDDPAMAERRAARQAVSTAREARLAEREANKIADQAREAAEQQAREAAEHEQRLAQEANEATAKVEAVERQVTLEAEQKAARDARYAARKARK